MFLESISKACIPQRYILGIMGFLGIANAYIMRACLSIAITQMVIPPQHRNTNSTQGDPYACPAATTTSQESSIPIAAGEFDWDEAAQGKILAAFYFGYIITHVPGGLLAQRFGGKHTMSLGILSTAIFTLLTPYVAHQGIFAMCLLRFLMGLGEGTTFPALSTLLAQWSPPLERSRLAALIFAGVQIGTVVATALSGIILQYVPGGWPNVFYIFGTAGLLWFVVWCLLCYNDPASHPFVSEQELLYLKSTIGQTERKKDLGGTPWVAILTSGPVWALTVGEVGHDWGLYTMVTDLPKYMSDVMHFNIAQNGLLSALPYLVMWFVSMSSGILADWILARGLVTITALRKILATVGSLGPALGVILASYAGCNQGAVAALFAVGMGFMGFFYASLRVNALDLSPNFSGTIMAIANGMGSISGMIAPYLIGVLTPNRTLMEWRVVFWIMVAVLILSNLVFVSLGSGELQSWNEPKKEDNIVDNIEIRDKRRCSSLSNSGDPIREKYAGSEFSGHWPV